MIRPGDTFWCFAGRGDDVPERLRGTIVPVRVDELIVGAQPPEPGHQLFRVSVRFASGVFAAQEQQLSKDHTELERRWREPFVRPARKQPPEAQLALF